MNQDQARALGELLRRPCKKRRITTGWDRGNRIATWTCSCGARGQINGGAADAERAFAKHAKK